MFGLANPDRFMRFTGPLVPVLWICALGLLLAGTWFSFTAPADYQQGDTVRIMFIHVPAASLGLMAYGALGVSSFFALVFRHPLADAAARAAAVPGAAFTALALITGALWGKPMWGTWWVWDARLTSELILLFLYLGYMALRSSFDDPQRADRASAVLAIVGVINVPIIHYSVEWWTTLHQPASVTKLDKPSIALEMLYPLFIMMLGFQLYFGWAISRRLRGEILRRERNAKWLKESA